MEHTEAGNNRSEWTAGRSLLLLFLSFDVLIIAVWFIKYYDIYERTAKVVGGVWGAVVALLAFLGVKGAKESRSLASILALLPVKIIGIVYTGLIFLFLPLFALWEFPLHTVEVKAELPGGQRVNMEMKHNTDEKLVYRNERGVAIWRFWAKTGNYTLTMRPENAIYPEQTLPVDICLPCLNNKVELKDHLALGTLVLNPSPPGMKVLIDGKQELTSPATVTLPAGKHTIVFSQAGINDEFGFYYEQPVTVTANSSAIVGPSLNQIRLPVLRIIPLEPERAFVYSLKSRSGSRYLGPITDLRRYPLLPGSYQLMKQLGSEKVPALHIEILKNDDVKVVSY